MQKPPYPTIQAIEEKLLWLKNHLDFLGKHLLVQETLEDKKTTLGAIEHYSRKQKEVSLLLIEVNEFNAHIANLPKCKKCKDGGCAYCSPCNCCQGGGCPVCSGFGYFIK